MTTNFEKNTETHVPTHTGSVVAIGISLVALLVGGLGVWGGTAELASAVIATGRVAVDSESKTIRHKAGGVVREIRVRNGDVVAAGEVIVQLDDTEAKAAVAILEQKHDLALAGEARLLAERDSADSILIPQALQTRGQNPDVAALLQSQDNLFQARRQARQAQNAIYQRRIVHNDSEIAALTASAQANKEEIALATEEYQLQTKLYKKKLIVRSRLVGLKRLKTSLEGRSGALAAQIVRAERARNEAALALTLAEREFIEEVETALRDVRAELVDLRERLTAARFTLAATKITAPEAGVVVNRQVRVAGDVVQPGGHLMDLVPTNDTLIVEASVRPVDIDNLLVGQEADLRFTAFSQRTTPLLQGRVIYVAADVVEEPRTGLSYYKARIAVPESEVARIDDGHLQPGMPADVAIKTGTQTVLDYLLKPLRESLFKAWREA